MRNFKKFLSLGLAVAMVAGMAACGDPKSKDKNSPDGTDGSLKGTTITLMASQDWIQDAEMELGEKFTEETGI